MHEWMDKGDAKSMMGVFDKETYPKLVRDFNDSRFDQLFYSPFIISNFEDDQLRGDVENLINTIITGDNLVEFILKSRPLFSFFDYDPVVGFSNHSNYYEPLGEKEEFGTVVVLNRREGLDGLALELEYRLSFFDKIRFTIQCFNAEAVIYAMDSYDRVFPAHLLFKEGAMKNIESYVMKILSSIRYSSQEELLLKLATFATDLDVTNILSTPLLPGKRRRYSLKSFGNTF